MKLVTRGTCHGLMFAACGAARGFRRRRSRLRLSVRTAWVGEKGAFRQRLRWHPLSLRWARAAGVLMRYVVRERIGPRSSTGRAMHLNFSVSFGLGAGVRSARNQLSIVTKPGDRILQRAFRRGPSPPVARRYSPKIEESQAILARRGATVSGHRPTRAIGSPAGPRWRTRVAASAWNAGAARRFAGTKAFTRDSSRPELREPPPADTPHRPYGIFGLATSALGLGSRRHGLQSSLSGAPRVPGDPRPAFPAIRRVHPDRSGRGGRTTLYMSRAQAARERAHAAIRPPEAEALRDRAARERPVDLIWRQEAKRSGTGRAAPPSGRTSEPLSYPAPAEPRTAIAGNAASGGPAVCATALDPALASRLAEDVIRRIDRRASIERERRGF